MLFRRLLCLCQTDGCSLMDIPLLEKCIWPCYDLWPVPWKTFQRFPLTWWIFVTRLIEIPSLNTELLWHMKQLLTDGRTTNELCSPPTTAGGGTRIKRHQYPNSIKVSVTNVSYEHFHSAETGYAQHLNSHLSPWARMTAAVAAAALSPAPHPAAAAARQLAVHVCYASHESAQCVSPFRRTSLSATLVLGQFSAGRWSPAPGFLHPEQNTFAATQHLNGCI